MSLIDDQKKLFELIDESLKQPKTLEKREFGEVFTPIPIIFEMLETLDEHYKIANSGKSIFANKDYKWFDPACGLGNFQIAVYMKLMKNLEDSITDDESRKKHILENMLYMSELNENNAEFCRNVFNADNKYNTNIHVGDTLLMDSYDFKFDVVLGNPPYNSGGIHSHTKTQLSSKNQTIWPKFVKRAIEEWLKPGGYLVFINPLSWLKKCHSLHDSILEKKLLWLKLWTSEKSSSAIKAAIPISLYVLENTPNIDNKFATNVITETGKKTCFSNTIKLDKKYSIPIAFHDIFDKLSYFIKKNNCALDVKSKTIKAEKEYFKLPENYKLTDNLAVHTYRIKDGIIVSKVAEKNTHPDADKRKLIISNKCNITVGLFIDEGKLSLSGYSKHYILGDNLELILKLLSFDIFKIVNKFTKYAQSFTNYDAFLYVPDIRKMPVSNLTEAKFYKMLNLTKSQIEEIKNNI